jgi:hypothetical protein
MCLPLIEISLKISLASIASCSIIIGLAGNPNSFRSPKRCESKPAITLVKPPTAVPIKAAKAVTMEPSPDGTQTPNLQLGTTAGRSAEAVASYAQMQKQAWI